jgi:hypothetical protein
VRRDLSTRETGTGVESNTITPGTAINLNLSCVRLEVCSSIFGSDTTLNCKAALCDGVLRQTKLRKSRTGCDLYLGSDDVKSRDFLCYRISKRMKLVYGKEFACDGMFDLDARIDLNKVMSSLLIN